jgi:5-methylthioadenosine/S-adenosylhomocysteine deaminase
MRLRFTARALVIGDRAGTVVPDAVLDVADERIAWAGPAADAPGGMPSWSSCPGC